MTEEQFEKLLSELPRFQRSPKSNQAFLDRLHHDSHRFHLPRFRFHHIFRFAYGTAFAVLLLLGGGTFAAYQSSITRLSPIYPLKQMGEKAELAFTVTPTQRVETHVRFSNRRLEEAESIIAQETNSSTLSFFIPRARALDALDIPFSQKAMTALEATLQDMRQEMLAASTVIEEKIEDTETATKALQIVERATGSQLEKLDSMKKNRSAPVQQAIEKIAKAQDAELGAVIEAVVEAEEKTSGKSQASQEKKSAKEVLGEKFITKGRNNPQQHKKQAVKTIREAVRINDRLPTKERGKFTEKIWRAETFLEVGKVGRGLGESRTVLKEIQKAEKSSEERELKEAERASKPAEIKEVGKPREVKSAEERRVEIQPQSERKIERGEIKRR